MDIAKKFGKYENNKFTEGSYAHKWIKEANLTEDVGKSFTVFGEIISDGVFQHKNYFLMLKMEWKQ